MKIKSFYPLAFFLISILGLSVTSCKDNDDDAAPIDQSFEVDSLKLRNIYVQDSLNRIIKDREDSIKGINNLSANLVFTVHIVDGTNMSIINSALRTNGTKGLSDINVTVAQAGILTTVTTNSNGQAVFPSLNEGTVAVTVEAENHTNVNFVAELNKPGAADEVTYASTIVPIYITSGTSLAKFNGRAFAEFDATNVGSEKVPNRKVVARLDASSVPLFNTENVSILSRGYEEVVYTTTTAADGTFSFNLPSGATNNMLKYIIDFEQFLGDQSTSATTTEKMRFYFTTSPSITVASQGIYNQDFFYFNSSANN